MKGFRGFRNVSCSREHRRDTLETVLRSGFSRIPVHIPGEPDRILGMVLVKVRVSLATREVSQRTAGRKRGKRLYHVTRVPRLSSPVPPAQEMVLLTSKRRSFVTHSEAHSER